MSTVELERVLVVPTRLFHDLGYFQGFSSDTGRYIDTLLDAGNTSYRLRGEMEQDPSWKQLIPYVLFEYDGPDGKQLFQYTRGSGQGEVRLHAKKSVGIGGHISSVDDAAESVYLQGMKRELAEEVIIETDYAESCVGMINDDETDVGRVHLGIVHVFRVKRPAVEAREADIRQAGFASLPDIMGQLQAFETWSQICLKALYGL
jgi:predicted NUDIX family phosphoesterase